MSLRPLGRIVLRLKKGDPITVVIWNGSIVAAAEVYDPEPGEFTKRFLACTEKTDHRLRYEDEGVEWCRGHTGEDVDALMATEAMADRTQPLRPANPLKLAYPITGRWSSKPR